MNATSLYVSTCRLIILADAADKSSWIDLFRLVPYLRQSLSCTVCGNLLKEPYTPTSSGCQHHVCKKCKGGRKKLKPSCGWCKDYDKYAENLQLRILLQCYKKLCEYFMGTDVYKTLLEEDEITAGVNGGTVASSGLIDLIQEGADFDDDYKSTAGLSKSAYSILPCVYTNSASTQTQVASTTNSEAHSKDSHNSRSTNGSPMYSVMYAGSGNKITIKRKAVDEVDSSSPSESTSTTLKESKSSFKKPSNRNRSSTGTKRKGCRCGNATATPGKLTCCGQRCPCYVESKPCTECKCKGCRNPHRPDGMKVRLHIPQLENHASNSNPDSSPSCSGSVDSMDADSLTMESVEETITYNPDETNIKVPGNIIFQRQQHTEVLLDGATDHYPVHTAPIVAACASSVRAVHRTRSPHPSDDHVPEVPSAIVHWSVLDPLPHVTDTDIGNLPCSVYTTEFRDTSPQMPPTILMDDDLVPDGSADDDTSSPQDYNPASPGEGDTQSVEDDLSSQSNDTQGEDPNSDIDVDV